MNVELTPAEMKSQARAKLEEALKIVARNQAEYSSFYGLLSDDVPTCYVVEYADDADLYARSGITTDSKFRIHKRWCYASVTPPLLLSI